MLSRERLQKRFLEMIQIYSPSLEEKEMCGWLVEYLKARGLAVEMDQAGAAYGGNAGNIVAYLKGTLENAEPLCFCAHTDQVPPCRDIVPVIAGNYIRTDGTTTLGGDDKGGIAAILEALEDVLESGKPRRDIYLLFTVSEEAHLLGAKNMDYGMLPCRRLVVADSSGDCGSILYKAPSSLAIQGTFYGKAAHAGIEPEAGINAVVAASRAIANMHIGRIDAETTSNIGRIEGGGATNIVTDCAFFTAEIRSHNAETLLRERNHMERCCKEAAASIGATCEFVCETAYPALSLEPEGFLCRLVQEAMLAEDVAPHLEVTGGGSDGNVLAGAGYECVILSIGMENIHSTKEQLNMEELWKTTRVLRRMMAES